MDKIRIIEGGVCAAKGFKANGIHCGIRRNRAKRDLAMIFSDVPAAAAGVYTTNLVKGAPLSITKRHISNGTAQAVICNSGNANTWNADGPEVAEKTCRLVSEKLGIPVDDIIVASTGVIGLPLDITPIANGLEALYEGLNYDGSTEACEAIMTTDTVKKQIAVEFELGGKTCRIGGICKGSGMIHPNMATMLVFITSDVKIKPELLQKILSSDIKSTFNMLSVDGDTSTNDMVCVMCNGLAENPEICDENEDYALFAKALNTVNVNLSRMIVGDGEGATKSLECLVSGAKDEENAKKAAKSVVCSSLLKAAMFGADANWGRVLCAIGYSGAEVDITKVDMWFRSAKGEILVCEDGSGVEFCEEKAKEILLEKDIDIIVRLHDGDASAAAWGCDLSYDYVRINGDYRT